MDRTILVRRILIGERFGGPEDRIGSDIATSPNID
jgi:hypothetical protein